MKSADGNEMDRLSVERVGRPGELVLDNLHDRVGVDGNFVPLKTFREVSWWCVWTGEGSKRRLPHVRTRQ